MGTLGESKNQLKQTSLLGDFHANRSPKQVKDEARQMTVTSGLKCLELFDLHNRHGLSLRTCVAYLLGTKAWYSSKSALTWKPHSTKYSRLLFQLSPSTLPIGETVSGGLLATPNTLDNMEPKTPKAIQKEATVTRKGRTNFANLKEQIAYGKLLPTPDAHQRGARVNQNGHQLTTQDVIGQQTGLKLQPNFVEWMMGFPIGWTELKPSATPSSPKSQLK